jgi:hypothetical protein
MRHVDAAVKPEGNYETGMTWMAGTSTLLSG